MLIIAATSYGQLPSVSPISFARHPSISPDGAKIAFSYAGDIWVVASSGGDAVRLTTHPAYEQKPHWSPDGRWIAFTGARDGDEDVYLIPSQGGTPRQLTFLDTEEEACDWTADGSAILFSSRRADRYPNYEMLYSVPVVGGQPLLVSSSFAMEAVENHQATQILFTTSGGQWWRKHYKTSGSPQVWRFDRATGEITPVSDTSAHLTGSDFCLPATRWPLWLEGDEIAVTSERDGTANLWKLSSSGVWSQLTHYNGDGLRFPSASRNRNLLAFEQGTDIWLLKPDGSSPQKVSINAPLDDPSISPIEANFNDHASNLDFSPDGKQMFLVVRGEVVAGRIVGDEDKAARGKANVLSQGNPARESGLAVSVGGDSLVVVSDRLGNRDLFVVTSNDPDTKELSRALALKWEPLVTTDLEEYAPQISPDGKLLAYRRGLGDLIIRDLAKGKEWSLLEGWSLLQFSWSPDSKWIAFAREDNEFNSEVFLIPAAGGNEVNVSRHPDEDEQPVWSEDGSKLAFRSRRRENNWDIFAVQLKLADFQKTAADRAEEIRLKAAVKKESKDEDPDKKKEKKEEKKEDKKPVEVLIDTTEIHLRVQHVTKLPGEESTPAFSPDGEKIVFTANHEGDTDLYIAKWSGEGVKRLTTGGANPSSIDFDANGKRVRYLDGAGRVKSIDADGGNGKDHPFDVRITILTNAERKQKFDEVWRGLDLKFYDAEFHGNDWQALHTKYSEWAKFAACEDDFGDVVRMMMGELNASHMGYYSGGDRNRKSSGRLGFDLDPFDSERGWVVSHVIKGGPVDLVNCKLEVGDRLVSVAGCPLTEFTSIDSLLRNNAGERVALTILHGKKELRIIVKPIRSHELGDLRYDEWVDARRQLVDSLSAGRIGFVHIRGMGEESLARFEAELYSIGNGKDALVIDVRNNGGGWTTDWMLAMLQVKRHAVTYPRDGGPGYPQDRLPLYAWTKPIVTLCNEHSFSNAEIFSHSIKTLKRGTVVGVPTPGGVISTGGDDLVDGSSYRIPLRGWYIGDNPERDSLRNMEGHGAVPDLIVPLNPGQVGVTEDLQLIKAVEEISGRLKKVGK